MRNLTKALTLFPFTQFSILKKLKTPLRQIPKINWSPRFNFSSDPPSLTSSSIPEANLHIQHEEVQVDGETVQSFATLGTLSILDKIKGAKNAQNGELYALMFTCAKCNTKAIRTFTKNAYHKGVVLIRCEGCQNIHLIADNLGWFQDQPTNLDQLVNKQQIKKVHDPVAITKFLKTAFGDNKQTQVPNEPLNPNFQKSKGGCQSRGQCQNKQENCTEQAKKQCGHHHHNHGAGGKCH